jgi:Trk K+ transport system NAD-binding subunit
LWPIALALFAVRLVGIFGGSFSGGIYAGDPMKHNRLSWLAYVTQAGIGLGLAKEVAVEFPEWGTTFATLMIAVIVLNQLTGPPLLKWAIEMIGEAHTRAETPEFDGVRDAIIFGLEGQALALAHQLHNHGWEVKLAAREASYRPEMINSDFDVYSISSLSLEELYTLEADKAEALVMLLSDEENYQLCELAYEHLGTENLIVRLNDRANFGRFHDLGALIVDPTTAIVSLLDHLVRSPTAASLLLGTDEDQDIIDLEVCNPNLHGLALRDLRLPIDTLILSVHRNGRGLISHGYTRLKIGDRVTIVGSTNSLEEVMLRFDPC